MPPDTTPGLGHPDAAGWALGALDPADAEAFEAHLPDCAGCQQAVAEFGAITRALTSAAPAVEPLLIWGPGRWPASSTPS